jgi:hypothetical protein
MVKYVRLMLIWANPSIPFVELYLVDVPVSLFTYSHFSLVLLVCLYRRWVLMLGVYSYPFGQSVTGLRVCTFLVLFLIHGHRRSIAVNSLVSLCLGQDV